MNKLLEIKDLVTNFYTYEGVVKAINQVSLEIEKDIVFGLVGESGCGVLKDPVQGIFKFF